MIFFLTIPERLQKFLVDPPCRFEPTLGQTWTSMGKNRGKKIHTYICIIDTGFSIRQFKLKLKGRGHYVAIKLLLILSLTNVMMCELS